MFRIGDGVENAFAYSRKVFTLSLHKYEEGYFPGTGAVQDVGLGQGRNYSCNVPLRDGACDETFIHVFQTYSAIITFITFVHGILSITLSVSETVYSKK